MPCHIVYIVYINHNIPLSKADKRGVVRTEKYPLEQNSFGAQMNYSQGQMITTQHKTSPNSPVQEPNTPYKGACAMLRHKYKECLKNHAASIGGNALDGCGEYIPTSSINNNNNNNDPLGSLKCAACGCHRNFHRKEFEGESFAYHPTAHYNTSVNPIGPHQSMGVFPGVLGVLSESEDHGDGLVAVEKKKKKKRVRTKFSQEQKEKMMRFAEKAGWKMVGLDDSLVQHFCQDVGIKRRVLKVWMHNNKHNYVNKKQSNALN